jgi:hypothetical protein
LIEPVLFVAGYSDKNAVGEFLRWRHDFGETTWKEFSIGIPEYPFAYPYIYKV